jgi:protoheme IX farnesyltransferase
VLTLSKSLMIRSNFAKFAWFLLAYNLVVTVWGAFVRASFSGDGCGQHWPDCGGHLVTIAGSGKPLIEHLHRISTEIDGFLILGLALWACLGFAKGSIVKRSSLVALGLTGVEALIGRHLVVNHLVATNASPERAIWISMHLISIFMLLGSLGLTALWASGLKPPVLRGQGAIGWALGFGFLGVVVLGISGAMTALSDTLFKAASLSQALQQDFSATAHFLVRLRPLHPLIAVSVGIYAILISGLLTHLRPSGEVKRLSQWMGGLFLLQLALGTLDLLSLAPIWMQLIHVFFSELLWISLVLLAASAFAQDVPRTEVVEETFSAVTEGPRTVVSVLKQYVVLTKPKVISLLLFTTITAMFMAARGWPGFWLLLAVTVGGYMSAGAANTINMVIDRDIDGTMKRTASRPTVTQDITSRNALLFGLALEVGSFTILWSAANLLCAMLALAGLAFYVVVYTLILKRRTWQNIVIGGAAGSFPPLVGWAAVTNDISPLAWYLFAIIFVWTPVHFWALALMIKEDYARAGVPMLPVVRGERATVIQILFYAVLTAAVSIMPMLQPHVNWAFLAVACALNAVLLLRALQLFMKTERPQAVSLYKFSMLYLALLFLAIAIERAQTL